MKESEVSSHPELLSLPPQAISSIFNDGCSSIGFPALKVLSLRDNVLLESNFFKFFSILVCLDLSCSGIVIIPTCIKRFVSLKDLDMCNWENSSISTKCILCAF
jgi:hypothetical protein